MAQKHDPDSPRQFPVPQFEEEDNDEIERQRFREVFWFPLRDKAARCILEAASDSSALVASELHEAVERGSPDESFSALVCCLAGLLAAGDHTARHAAARLLGHAFSPLEGTIMAAGTGVPEELEQALPAILGALAVRDGELRLRLLGILKCLARRRCAPAILPPLLEHLFDDGAPEVVVETLAVVMTAGVDLASAAIPQIIGLLAHRDDQVLLSACNALAKFGAEADRAVPQLLKVARSDSSSDVRERTALALAAVDPEGERLSQELPDRAGRDAFLSFLRVIGPPVRGLRVRLGRRPLPRIALDQHTRTITYDGTPYPDVDKTAFLIFKAIWDARPEPVSSRVLNKLPGLRGKHFNRELGKLTEPLSALVDGKGNSGYEILLPPPSSP